MTQDSQNSRRFKSFLNPRTVLFGICLLNVIAVFVMTLAHIRELERIRQATGFYISHANPTAQMIEPLVLVVAAAGLLIHRWWSVLAAMLGSMTVIYSLGYIPWTGVDLAHGAPMLSWQAMELLWSSTYLPQPQYLVAVALAVVILVYAIFLSVRFMSRRVASPTHGG